MKCCMLRTQRPAFASHNSSSSDVNKFFEDCKHPPTLDLFTSDDGLDVQEALVRIHVCLLLECVMVDVQYSYWCKTFMVHCECSFCILHSAESKALKKCHSLRKIRE